ncbi:UNVERIFIED_CONTAM: hypothetical protein GTU68_012047 [Idotea baltica]|nr:hypothetical protein [Idotea baltica]
MARGFSWNWVLAPREFAGQQGKECHEKALYFNESQS